MSQSEYQEEDLEISDSENLEPEADLAVDDEHGLDGSPNAEVDGTEDSQDAPAKAVPEPPPYVEEPEDNDHRVARLRKLRRQFVSDEELSLPSTFAYSEIKPQTILCPNCNSEELLGLKFCSSCDARLPNLILDHQKFNPGSVNEAVKKYQDAVTNLVNETWDLEEFVDFLNKEMERVKSISDYLSDPANQDVMSEWLPDAYAKLLVAAHLWEESTESMMVRVENCIADFDDEDALFEDLDDEEAAEREPPAPLGHRAREIDFTPDLENIVQANDQFLEYLRISEQAERNYSEVNPLEF